MGEGIEGISRSSLFFQMECYVFLFFNRSLKVTQGQISSEINFLTLQEIFELNELNIRVSELIILARADLMELKSSEIFCLSYT